MEVVDGGTLPDSDEPNQEVEFFARMSSTTPNIVPSLFPVDSKTAVEMPLFPLQLVVNPGTNVPLHIFEMRYREMFNSVRETDSTFGIVLYEGKSNSLALVGCTAEVTQYDPLPDGRIMTNNVGRQRFKIVRIIEEKPYIRAKVELLQDAAPSENVLPLIQEVWAALDDVLVLSKKLYEKEMSLSVQIRQLAPTDDGANLKPAEDEEVPEGWPSPKLVEEFSFAVAQVLDMPLKVQQVMLQMTNTASRLRKQLKMLTTARKYLAAQVTIKNAGLKDF